MKLGGGNMLGRIKNEYDQNILHISKYIAYIYEILEEQIKIFLNGSSKVSFPCLHLHKWNEKITGIIPVIFQLSIWPTEWAQIILKNQQR